MTDNTFTTYRVWDRNEIERERNGYEVEATSLTGERVKLLVDPVTGAMLDSRSK